MKDVEEHRRRWDPAGRLGDAHRPAHVHAFLQRTQGIPAVRAEGDDLAVEHRPLRPHSPGELPQFREGAGE
ncbi:hypothetical protein AB0L44_46215 [Nonomuraea wenchangensis]|uniref:hypothetical protein n=1 Tax=Nonomuraea wenchangensis TaxID=568860 RepID=UPI003430220C